MRQARPAQPRRVMAEPKPAGAVMRGVRGGHLIPAALWTVRARRAAGQMPRRRRSPRVCVECATIPLLDTASSTAQGRRHFDRYSEQAKAGRAPRACAISLLSTCALSSKAGPCVLRGRAWSVGLISPCDEHGTPLAWSRRNRKAAKADPTERSCKECGADISNRPNNANALSMACPYGATQPRAG